MTDLKLREKELKSDLKLPTAWKVTKDIQAAIDFYKKNSVTTVSKILEDSKYTANTLSRKMKELVDDDEAILNGTTITRLISGLKQMPDVINSLVALEKAVLKELSQRDNSVGSQEKALYEEGLNFDDENE